MKKILLLFLSVLFISSCSFEYEKPETVVDTQKEQQEQEKRQLSEAKQRFIAIEQKMSLKENDYDAIVDTLRTYLSLYIEEDYESRVSSRWNNNMLHMEHEHREDWGNNHYYMDRDNIDYVNMVVDNVFQPFAESDIKLYCFVGEFVGDYDYYDKSDECILARRNAKKSEVGYYNYKKYLPSNSKIDSDEKFLELVDIYKTLFAKSRSWNNEKGEYEYYTYCDSLKEKTTTEKQQCKEDAREYLKQIVEGNVPHCRNRVNKEYMEFLKEKARAIIGMNALIQRDIDDRIFVTRNEKDFGKAFYQGAFGQMLAQAIKEFGHTHFCRTDNFNQDIKKALNSK